MGAESGIEWTDSTWNPWYGCHKISQGCKFCYMFRDMARYGRDANVVQRAASATFHAPLRWKEGRRIFTCSWSDFFIEEADAWRAEARGVILQTPQHTYQILTKRPERVGDYWFENVWLGVSVENRAALPRIDILRTKSAGLRFLSIEPLIEDLGEIDLTGIGWVIIGGESGGNEARKFGLAWARSIVAQCTAAGVACFVKQLGRLAFDGDLIQFRAGADPKGGDWDSWPEDLRVRQFPGVRHA